MLYSHLDGCASACAPDQTLEPHPFQALSSKVTFRFPLGITIDFHIKVSIVACSSTLSLEGRGDTKCIKPPAFSAGFLNCGIPTAQNTASDSIFQRCSQMAKPSVGPASAPSWRFVAYHAEVSQIVPECVPWSHHHHQRLGRAPWTLFAWQKWLQFPLATL